jgi:hypothetical protein
MSVVAFEAAEIRALTHNGAITRPMTAGGTITVGHLVYNNGTANTVVRADADASQAASAAIGIAVESYNGETTIVSGDPVTVCVYGPVSGFSGATPGALGWVSDTVGRLDTAAGTYDRIMGYFESASVFFVSPDINNPSSA